MSMVYIGCDNCIGEEADQYYCNECASELTVEIDALRERIDKMKIVMREVAADLALRPVTGDAAAINIARLERAANDKVRP